jgi:hypothetical protein
VEEPEPIKVGDRVRVVADDPEIRTGEYVGKVGLVATIGNRVRRELVYRISFPDGDYWWVADVERVTDENTYTHDGVTYDLSAKYRDKDGDEWTFTDRGFGPDGTPNGAMNGYAGGNYSYTLGYAAQKYGPLARITD